MAKKNATVPANNEPGTPSKKEIAAIKARAKKALKNKDARKVAFDISPNFQHLGTDKVINTVAGLLEGTHFDLDVLQAIENHQD